ncbi:uncharacterized protein GJ701_007341 [Geothlypis trichas]
MWEEACKKGTFKRETPSLLHRLDPRRGEITWCEHRCACVPEEVSLPSHFLGKVAALWTTPTITLQISVVKRDAGKKRMHCDGIIMLKCISRHLWSYTMQCNALISPSLLLKRSHFHEFCLQCYFLNTEPTTSAQSTQSPWS